MPGTRWCPRADEIFGVEGVHVLEVRTDAEEHLVLDVETDQRLNGCPDCGVVAVGHGRRVRVLHDIAAFGRSVRVRWRKRIWSCLDVGCPRSTFCELHGLAKPRAKLTARAVEWAVDALRHDDTSVSALARHLGVDWHTCWDAIEVEAACRRTTSCVGRGTT